jgi:hypothetical protein
VSLEVRGGRETKLDRGKRSTMDRISQEVNEEQDEAMGHIVQPLYMY